MAPRKKDEAATMQPTRRSTRTRRPPNRPGDDRQDDTVVHRPKEIVVNTASPPAAAAAAAAKPDKAVKANKAGNGGKEQEEIQIPAIATDTTSSTTTITANVVGNEKKDEPVDQDHSHDRDREDSSAEEMIIAHSGQIKAAARSPPPQRLSSSSPSVPKAMEQQTQRRQSYGSPPVAGGEEDELAAERPAVKIIKVTESTRKGRSKYDRPEEMLTNPRSPLVNAKLRDILCSPKAWEILNAEEKKRVLAKFPGNSDGDGGGAGGEEAESTDTTTTTAGPDITSLRNNDDFRHDVARYQDDLGKGKHDPEWIRQAQEAHRHRVLGFYDEYLAARFEEDWGMPMPGGNADGVENGAAAAGDRDGVKDMENGADDVDPLSTGAGPDDPWDVPIGNG